MTHPHLPHFQFYKKRLPRPSERSLGVNPRSETFSAKVKTGRQRPQKRTQSSQSGQTLIALLIFMLVAITITLAAAAVAIINIQANTGFAAGDQALANAESGIEDTALRLEHDSTYTGGTVTLASGTATISVSGSSPITITSIGSAGHFRRTVTASATLSGNNLTITDWNETP